MFSLWTNEKKSKVTFCNDGIITLCDWGENNAEILKASCLLMLNWFRNLIAVYEYNNFRNGICGAHRCLLVFQFLDENL